MGLGVFVYRGLEDMSLIFFESSYEHSVFLRIPQGLWDYGVMDRGVAEAILVPELCDVGI